jgi:hypothetical protein
VQFCFSSLLINPSNYENILTLLINIIYPHLSSL